MRARGRWALSKTSIEFFKRETKKHNTQYQKLIRRLLDEYTTPPSLHTKKATNGDLIRGVGGNLGNNLETKKGRSV